MVGAEWTGWLQRCRESRRLILVIVAIALLLDNMLLTAVGKWKLEIFVSSVSLSPRRLTGRPASSEFPAGNGSNENQEEGQRARAKHCQANSHFPAV